MAYSTRKMQDIKYSEKALYEEYVNIWNNTNPNEILTNVATFLNTHPEFQYKILNASNWNRLINHVNDATDTQAATYDSLVGKWNKDYGDLQTASEPFKYVGEWAIGTQYKKNNLVKVDNYHSYFCIANNIVTADNQPPNTTYWMVAKAIPGVLGMPISDSEPTGLADGDIWLADVTPISAFKDADWETVKYVMQNNLYDKCGWNVGDTKTLTYIESGEEKTYIVRLSDKQVGRYKYSNSDRRTNGVLEMVEILTQSTQMNSTDTNVGGFAESRMRKTVNGESGYQYDLYSPLPADLQNILEDIDIPTATSGTDATVLTSACKVFLPSAPEVGLGSHYGRDVDGTVWDWYNEHGTNADRIKYRLGSTSGTIWWVRNPYPSTSDTTSFSGVYTGGSGIGFTASYSTGVVLCFAF